MKHHKYQVGDIVTIKKGFMGDPDGELGFIYEIYPDFDKMEENGVSILTKTGKDLGGFSVQEQKDYLEFVRHSDFSYTFTNVIQLERDKKSIIAGAFRDTFKKSYEFTCPECGHVQHAAPSIMMTGFGMNMGGGSCLKCKTYLHLEITPDLYGEKMIAEQHSVWIEREKEKRAHEEFSKI